MCTIQRMPSRCLLNRHLYHAVLHYRSTRSNLNPLFKIWSRSLGESSRERKLVTPLSLNLVSYPPSQTQTWWEKALEMLPNCQKTSHGHPMVEAWKRCQCFSAISHWWINSNSIITSQKMLTRHPRSTSVHAFALLEVGWRLVVKHERHLAQFESLQLSFIKISMSGNSQSVSSSL